MGASGLPSWTSTTKSCWEKGARLSPWQTYVAEVRKRGGLPFGKLFGVIMIAGWSWIALFCAFSFSLGPLIALSIYACVIAHEFGHVLMARHFGIPTLQIRLWFLGGAAEMKFLPRNCKQEIWISLVGPAVSLALSLGFFALALVYYQIWPNEAMSAAGEWSNGGEFFLILSSLNFIWVLFNMLPILPLDGGRVFRSLLTLKRGWLDGTRLAVRVAKFATVFVVGFLLAFDHYSIVIFLPFLWLASKAELRQAENLAEMDENFDGVLAKFDPDDERRWATIVLKKQLQMTADEEEVELLWKQYGDYLDSKAQEEALREYKVVLKAKAKEQKAKRRARLFHDGWREWHEAHKHEWKRKTNATDST